MDDKSEHYELGITVVSVLISITFSVLFGVYSITSSWWISVAAAGGAPIALAVLIRIGGEDGVISKLGRWILQSSRQ